MSEQEAVDNAPLPCTRQSLADDLRALGVEAARRTAKSGEQQNN
jgi:hypothetical protein